MATYLKYTKTYFCAEFYTHNNFYTNLNPKIKKLSELTFKDIDPKAIKLFGKKAKSKETALPFFIKTDYQYDEKNNAPLFLFGKIKPLKAELKPMKGATEQHGLAFVEYENKLSTLCIIPTRGKLCDREAILKRAMKETFGNKWAGFRILEPISEKDAEVMEAQADALAENMGDVVDDGDDDQTDNSKTNTEKPYNEKSQAAVERSRNEASPQQIAKLTEKLEEVNQNLSELVKKTNVLMSLDALYEKINAAEQTALRYEEIMDEYDIETGRPVEELKKVKIQINNLRKNAKNIVDIAELDPAIPEEWPDDLELPLKTQNELKNKIERNIESNPLDGDLLPNLAAVEKNLKAIYVKSRELTDAKTKASIQKMIEDELKKLIVLRQEVERERSQALKKIPAEDIAQSETAFSTIQALMYKVNPKLIRL